LKGGHPGVDLALGEEGGVRGGREEERERAACVGKRGRGRLAVDLGFSLYTGAG